MATGSQPASSKDLQREAIKFKKEETRFFEAIKQDDVKTVDKILLKKDFRSYMEQSDKLLLAVLQVVLLNSVTLLDVFIKHGVDVKSSDCMFFENGIMHAARYGHKDMLVHLIQCGVDMNHQCKNGSTALHIAIENIQRECLETLTKQRGIDLNIQDHTGYSPLLWTARLRDWRSMMILVNAGCKIESKNFTKGATALHIVVDSTQAFWKGKKATMDDTCRCIDLLLDSGLDINSCDVFGNSPLLYALRSNNLSAVAHLLKLNCAFHVDQQNSASGSSVMPFYFNQDVIGADPTLLPLYMAISKLQVKSVKMLCMAGIPYFRLAREPAVLEYMTACYEPMGDLLHDLLYTPVTLKQASRNAVRQSLNVKIRRVTENTLNLPVALMKYIFLEDLDEL